MGVAPVKVGGTKEHEQRIEVLRHAYLNYNFLFSLSFPFYFVFLLLSQGVFHFFLLLLVSADITCVTNCTCN